MQQIMMKKTANKDSKEKQAATTVQPPKTDVTKGLPKIKIKVSISHKKLPSVSKIPSTAVLSVTGKSKYPDVMVDDMESH